MFIIGHLDIIAIAVLMSVPFYFFNRYLLQKFKPAAAGKNVPKYLVVVFITALVYSAVGVLLLSWVSYLSH